MCKFITSLNDINKLLIFRCVNDIVVICFKNSYLLEIHS